MPNPFDDFFRSPPIPGDLLREGEAALAEGGDGIVRAGDVTLFAIDSRPYNFSLRKSRAMRLLLPVGYQLVARGWPIEKWDATELGYVDSAIRALRLDEMSDDEFATYAAHFRMDRIGIPLAEVRSWYRAVLAESDRRRLTATEAAARDRSARLARPRAIAEPVSLSCAVDGCERGRVFFDEDGTGYCKRHGNERGIRPHGKVT